MEYPIENSLFQTGPDHFSAKALQLFRFQYEHNSLYRFYVDALHVNPGEVQQLSQIPFMPVNFFKTHSIKTTEFVPELVFESSGTTQTINSRHLVKKASLYADSFTRGFEQFYGPADQWCIIGLLPSYLERANSSLVMMVDSLIKKSGHVQSGFYLNEFDKLNSVLEKQERLRQPVLLIGVTFALLDFAAQFPMHLKCTVVMETGGMKGRRKELTREEVHGELKQHFGVDSIHSEYGMTELLSQAYSKGNGIFKSVPWMKMMVRNEDDPMDVSEQGTGILNIIDLVNIYSAAFIATDDVATVFPDGRFEIWGRVDNSDLRGCSLLVM